MGINISLAVKLDMTFLSLEKKERNGDDDTSSFRLRVHTATRTKYAFKDASQWGESMP